MPGIDRDTSFNVFCPDAIMPDGTPVYFENKMRAHELPPQLKLYSSIAKQLKEYERRKNKCLPIK